MSKTREEKEKRPRRHTRVPASPLNPVKLELALALVIGVSLLVAVPRWVEDPGLQLALLAAYGLVCGLWIALRAHVLARRHQGGGF